MSDNGPNPEQYTLPRRNVEWAEAIVKWTRYDYVAIYSYPTIEGSDVVMQVYVGDMIELSRKYRRNNWCLCQVGHLLGWVYLNDVRFLVRGAGPKRRVPPPKPQQTESPTEPSVPIRSTPRYRANVPENPLPYLDETEVDVTSRVSHDPKPKTTISPDKKPLIERLIQFFKKG